EGISLRPYHPSARRVRPLPPFWNERYSLLARRHSLGGPGGQAQRSDFPAVAGSEVRQRGALECRGDEGPGLGPAAGPRRSEGHSSPPAGRRLWVDTDEDRPSPPDGPLDDRRRPVGILRDDVAPPGQVGAVLPVLFDRRLARAGDRHRGLADATVLVGVE